jgi:RluA family pseudouridine synthase
VDNILNGHQPGGVPPLDRLYIPAPTEQVYRSFVPQRYSGYTVENYFADRFNYLSRQEWIRVISEGAIIVNGQAVQPGTVLSACDQTSAHMGLRQEPPADRRLEIVFEDDSIRVFNKAAPIPVHPCGRYFKNSMTELLKEKYPEEIPRPVQRLDAETTGLIVFAKSRQVAAFLGKEFESGRMHKEYLALATGEMREQRIRIDAPIGRIKGSKRGVVHSDPKAQQALTEVLCLAVKDGASLLQVTPLTGRTNQIRVHLAQEGYPLYNDSVYGRALPGVYEFGLHAHRLSFQCFDRQIDLTARPPAHFTPWLDLT